MNRKQIELLGKRTENKMDIKKKEESRIQIIKGERRNDKKRMKIRKTKEQLKIDEKNKVKKLSVRRS